MSKLIVNFVETTLIMGIPELRKSLHTVIDQADERFLRMVQSMASEYSKDVDEDITLPGSPMSVEQYRTRIRKTKERVKAGHYTTHENLEKEMEQW